MLDTEQRIQRLEEEQYFQEQLLQELNKVVIDQGTQIDKLKQDFQDLQKQFLAMQELLAVKFENTPPPHYLPKV